MTRTWHLERQFGRGVGAVISVVGVWLVWKGSAPTAARALLCVGAALLTLGFIYPRALVYPSRAWMGLADALSFVGTRIILGLVFFVVITPLGVFKRWTGWDPLGRRRSRQHSYWAPYPARQRDPKHFEKMF